MVARSSMPIVKRKSIYRRSESHVYCVEYYLDGKLRKTSLHTKSKEEANRKWFDLKQEIESSLHQDYRIIGGTTLDEAMILYLDYRKHRVQASTFDVDRYWLSAAMRELGENKYVMEISEDDIREFVNRRVKINMASTVNLLVHRLSTFFQFCVDEHFIDASPVNAKKWRMRVQKMDPEVFQEDTIKAVMEYWSALKLDHRAFLAVLLFCGLRESEARGLSRNDIDLGKHVLWVRRKKCGHEGAIMQTILKSSKAHRSVVILEPGDQILKEYLESTDRAYIFEHIVHGTFDSMKNRIQRNTGIRITQRTFRHTWISILIRAGLDVKQVQRMAGHENATTTLQTYAGLFNPLDADEVRKKVAKLRPQATSEDQ